MNIKTVTFSDAQNWGAILQTYALCKYINSCNTDYNCEVIKYKNFDDRWFKPRKIIKDVLLSILFYKDNLRRVSRYKSFINQYIPFSSESSWEELNKYTDVFICGSDQVWNCSNGVVPEFYLELVSDQSVKMAYAPSFGIREIPVEHRERVSKAINRVDYLSVREASGKRIIKDLTGRDAEVVVDPVFLISENEWKDIAEKPNERDYIFVYVTEVSDKVAAMVKKYKTKNPTCKVISPYAIPGVKAIIKKDIGPAQFIGLVQNAKAIISTSFHATAFSLIFKKDFCVVPHSVTGSRVIDLLNKIGMNKAIYKDGYRLEDMVCGDQYRSSLENWIAESKCFIVDSLCEASKKRGEVCDV